MENHENPELKQQTFFKHKAYFDGLVKEDDVGVNRKRWTITDEMADVAYEAIKELQEKKGSPPTWMQVRQHLDRTDYSHIEKMNELKSHPFFKHALYARDKIYLTKCQAYISLEKWNSGYNRYMEKFKAHYAEPYGYVMDDLCRVRPGPTTKTVDFGELWDVLTSSDEQLLKDKAWMFEDQKDPKFLDQFKPASGKTPITEGEVVSYCSYPRCGNSFLRKYLQNITGIATGSDMALEFCCDLQFTDFKGEEITDGSVWIKKSHDPKWNNGNKTNLCNKAVVCVRHSYDCMASLMHFLPTLNQGGQINEKFSELPEVWDRLVKETAEAYEIYHREVIDNLMPACPVYFIRYEDLRAKPQETLEEVFCFLLNKESLEGLNIQRRISEIVNQGHKASVSYQQKVESQDLNKDVKPIIFNRSVKDFSPEQQELVAKKLIKFNHIFGYCSKAEEGQDLYTHDEAWQQEQQNKFNFVRYSSEDYDTGLFDEFKRMNQATMKSVLELAAAGKMKEQVYILNLDKPSQLRLPTYPNYMVCSMKEQPQVKDE